MATWKGGDVRDLTRTRLTRLVYQHLTDSGFRSRLTAESPAGERPIVVALREDRVGTLIEQVRQSGGSSNVVCPALKGFIVLAMTVSLGEATDTDGAGPRLTGDCTVGVFLERLRLDLGSGEDFSFQVVLEGPVRRVEQGHAEVVALGG
jgi:hypothetical protein